MKKISVSLAIILALTLTSYAQEDKVFGPRAGNFMISVKAEPFLEYAGNFFGKSSFNNAPYVEYFDHFHIYGKYFTTDNMGIRGGLNFEYGSETSFAGEEDQDKVTDRDFYTMISLGLERRHGQNRAQAFYGPQTGFGYQTSSRVFNYDETPATGTLLKENYGSGFMFHLGLFAGAEYYILPFLAVGTEIGFGLDLLTSGKGYRDREGEDRVETGSKSRDMFFGFGGPSGAVAYNGYGSYYGNINLSFKF